MYGATFSAIAHASFASATFTTFPALSTAVAHSARMVSAITSSAVTLSSASSFSATSRVRTVVAPSFRPDPALAPPFVPANFQPLRKSDCFQKKPGRNRA